jgi:hypothetical protein
MSIPPPPKKKGRRRLRLGEEGEYKKGHIFLTTLILRLDEVASRSEFDIIANGPV